MVMPVPVVAVPPGVRVSVHVPIVGKPLNTTLPVPRVHVGWVIVPMTGADGAPGAASITTSEDCAEAQPSLFVTV